MDETKRITTAFQDKAAGAGSIEALQCDLDNIEKAFTDCNEELAAMEMPDCGYCFQGEAILEMTENLRALFIYVGCAHPHVSEVLDFPLYTDFKSNATESLSHIVLDDIRTDNTFGMEEHVEVNDAGYLRVDSRVKQDLGFSDFFGITDIRPQDGYPVLENVETVGEFASLFRADYDRMKPKGMDINTFLEGYLTYGEYEHTGYHPVRDFLSGLADVTIIIPVIDAILGKDIITGETLNDFERGMKAAGAVIDLFTLGQAMVLAGGVEAGAGIIVKTLAVEMVSNAAGYSAGYAANEMGMPLPVTWILSVATGCTVSATVGGYLFTSADGTITKCTAEEAGDLIKRLDKTDSPASFADMMSPEDAARYLRFLENGSTEGLTSAELEGIKKVDELLALKKISYQDVLDIRNSGKALEGGKYSNLGNMSFEDGKKYSSWSSLRKEGLSYEQVEKIKVTPKGQKPSPETYLSNDYINNHLQTFKESGAVKIMPNEPTGTIGGKGGTFVMSGDELNEIIQYADGDVSKIETILGLDQGYLGKNPVIVSIEDTSSLRIPSGNELGAWPEYWEPGGYTSGGIKEAVVNPAAEGTYTYKHLFE